VPPPVVRKIKSLYVIGNSYSATGPAYAMNMWPGILSQMLGFPYVQANNAAQPSAGLDSTSERPGLLDQLRSLPTGGDRASALLVIWILPSVGADVNHVVVTYEQGVNEARALGFNTVLMPNSPDISKTQMLIGSKTPEQLAALHDDIIRFNVQYSALITGLQSKHPDMRIKTVDVCSRWDGQGTVDGLHPDATTARLFAQWFKGAI
jgi:hypothetical protein